MVLNCGQNFAQNLKTLEGDLKSSFSVPLCVPTIKLCHVDMSKTIITLHERILNYITQFNCKGIERESK